MSAPDPFQLVASALDPCAAVELSSRETVATRQYGINAVWQLEDGGQRVDALHVASSLQPDGGRQPIRFCFAPEGERMSVEQSISIVYRSEYIETMTTGAGQPCMVLAVDGRFTSVLDAGACPAEPVEAGSPCAPEDASDGNDGNDGNDAGTSSNADAQALLAQTHHAPPVAGCSVGAGARTGDVGAFVLIMVGAAAAAIVRRRPQRTRTFRV